MRTIQSELKRQGLAKEGEATKSRLPKKSKERLSKWDVEELMGIRRDTYTRRNGAVRRK